MEIYFFPRLNLKIFFLKEDDIEAISNIHNLTFELYLENIFFKHNQKYVFNTQKPSNLNMINNLKVNLLNSFGNSFCNIYMVKYVLNLI